ncbi:MAG: peptidylprolyl isomerase [Vicinamibacterales bacterium]
MKRAALVVAIVAIAGGVTRGAATLPRPALSSKLAHVVDPVIDALWSHFDLKAAQDHVRFVTGYWRLPGNAGFDATIDRVHARLRASGFVDGPRPAAGTGSLSPAVVVEEYTNPGQGWDHSIGTLAVVRAGRPDEVVLSRDRERIALCINSFSTPPEGVTTRVVDVGRGDQETDYAKTDVKGAVVMGDADVGQLWRRAVVGHGAIGVVSGAMGEYVNPNPPGAAGTPRETWNILQWGSIPYDEARKGFGFKATPRAMAALRGALASGPADVRVTIASTFSKKPARTLVAEIPGRVLPDERVVLAVHVQEPGASDNASGVATLAEVARALASGIARGRIPPPARTLTLLWLDEIAGSRQWLTSHPDEAKGVRYMFSMDMTGEDVQKTGGTFLIERWPDPGAVWDRPWDPHTEWGRGDVRADRLKGDLLNDVHLAVCLRVARKGGWIVNTNPYEGGSDHTVFGNAGIPSVLDWHFTDRYYHTNLDTADKTSAAEMRNVGVAAVATAWLLASAREPVALAVADLVAKAGQARVVFEEREGARLAAAEPDQDAARLREDQIVGAWKKWYGEAVESVSRLVVDKTSPAFQAKLDQLAAPFVDAAPARSTGAGFRIVDASYERSQGTVVITRETVQLALDRMLADRWFPSKPQPANSRTRDQIILTAAFTSPRADIRRVAIRGLGQFENPLDVPTIRGALDDEDPGVRREAANAIAQAAVHSKGADVEPAMNALLARMTTETDGSVMGTMHEALARLHYGNAALEAKALTALARDPKNLVILLRNDPALLISDEERRFLQQQAKPPDAKTAPSVEALEALGIAHDTDTTIVEWAGSYHCPREPYDCGWEVRYAAVQRMDAANPTFDAALSVALRDVAFQVRMAALRKYGAAISRTKECGPLVATASDGLQLTIVRMEAVSLLTPACSDRDDIHELLAQLAGGLKSAERSGEWHLAARAFETLARFDEDAARRLMTDVAASSGTWQIRAAAARVAAVLRDQAALVVLAGDPEPNVQTEALTALTRLKSAAVTDLALNALDSKDYQLVRAAALALQGNKRIDVLFGPLLTALKRLTAEGKDTSRDPRLAVLARIKDLAAPDATGVSPLLQNADDVGAFLSDFDPAVASAAADIVGIIKGTRPDPTPTHRPVEQPTEQQLVVPPLPGLARIVFDGGGLICIGLDPADAPLAVYRFVTRANAHYYDNLTFHRVVPLFVIQGGSPGANEYMGDARYMRDELGLARHVRGAVGLSTRGRDTGDGQIFFDLIDQPRLNDDYTIFAQVVTPITHPDCSRGFEVMDGILEGARIRGITFELR